MPNTQNPQREPVHPSILGVPQGWEDDPRVPLDSTPADKVEPPARFRDRVKLFKTTTNGSDSSRPYSLDSTHSDLALEYPPAAQTYLAPKSEPVYKVGWGKDVLDTESRLHQAMFELFARHTLVDTEPATVLDIGTGLGSWPIAQASIWKGTRFVGMDIADCQVDLSKLARESVEWKEIHARVGWQRGDFLTTFPFDAASFDMVHIRFIGLGVPETKWVNVLEEASRVLKPGGTLEIVEMGYKACNESIEPDTTLPINFALPLIDSLVHTRPVFSQPVIHPVLSEVVHKKQVGRIKNELRKVGWRFPSSPMDDDKPVTITVWVVTKK